MNNNLFDQWANSYDESVKITDENNSYPFAGYSKIINKIYGEIILKKKADILDIGFGTGTLIAKLADKGFNIWGQDSSEKMIELAKEKMPKARLFKGDFCKGIVAKLRKRKYDFIIATYSLHHLNDHEKIIFIESLFKLLKSDGIIIIGDVAFETREELNRCKKDYDAEWDDEEHYFIYNEIKSLISFKTSFEKVSHCAGILRILQST